MASIRTNFCKWFIKTTLNMNPEKKDKSYQKMMMLEMFRSKRPNLGFKAEYLKTPAGTKYEHHYKKDFVKNGKVVLYLHGGGYCAGLISLYRKLAKKFSEAAGGADVFYLDYDCAPEYKYPHQLNQALDFWHYLTNDLGYKPEDIIVGGDSAGGNLTLALSLKLKDMGEKMPRAIFCISAWADMLGTGFSYITNYSNDALFGKRGAIMTEEKKKALMDSSIFSFCIGMDRGDKYISPVYADYEGFPPAFFTVGSNELLLADTVRIYENMKGHGNDVDIAVGEELFHVYPCFYQFVPEGRRDLKRILAFITRQFNK